MSREGQYRQIKPRSNKLRGFIRFIPFLYEAKERTSAQRRVLQCGSIEDGDC